MSQTGTVHEHPVTTGLSALSDGLDTALAGPLWQLSDQQVDTSLDQLLAAQAKTAALQAALLAEAQARNLKAGTRASTDQRWLGDRFRLSPTDAATRLRQTAQLTRHPAVHHALATGTLTTEQASITATALDQLALLPQLSEPDRDAATEFLLHHATQLTPRDLTRAATALIETLTTTPSPDDPADAESLDRDLARAEARAQAAERNDLHLGRRHGRLRAVLDLGPLGEATLHAWLRHTDTPVPGQDGFTDQRTLSERRADTLVELLTTATTGTRVGSSTGPDRADEAGSLTDPLTHHPSPTRPASSGPTPNGVAAAPGPIAPPALLTITTTLAELRAALPGTARLDTGATLSAATLRQLACDANVLPAVLASPAQILDLGRSTPVWNRAQRRAVALRDRGCIAPGCHQPPAACQVHHSWHWIDGGPTDLANAALLCGFHHRMVHRQGWGVTLAPNGYPQLIPPATIDPDRRPRQHHRFQLTQLTTRRRT